MAALQPVPVEGSALVETCDVCIVGAGLAARERFDIRCGPVI